MIARLLSLQDVSSARRYYGADFWQDYSLYQRLAHWAELQPQTRALIDSLTAFTYGDLRQWVDTYATVLSGAGLTSGDRVAIWSPSRMESVAALLACSRMGYVCVPSLHRDHTPDSVLAILKRTRAAAFVVQCGYGANLVSRDVAAEAAALPHMRHVAVLDPLVEDGVVTARFGGLEPRATSGLPIPGDDPDRVVYLAFTSGTTGDPKGVMHSDNTLLANGRAIVNDFGFGRETVVYSLSPMSHNMGTVSLAIMLACGGALVVHGPLDAARTVDRIVATGASYLVGVPTHGMDLIAQLGERGSFGNVGCFQLAGSPVPLRLAQALIERGIIVQNCYGMTENCSFLYTRPEDDVEVVTQTCGRCCDGMEIAILDPENGDRPMPDGEVGEIGIRGASMMLGYFDDQAGTEASYTAAGWFLSGDLGVRDRRGNVKIVGRKKDLIIRGGRNIHPAELEDLAMRHPAVGRAAAFAVADERLGEKICLVVTAKQGSGVQAHDLLAHLARLGLSPYHMPEYFIQLDDLPLTASGKVLKRELAAMAADGRITPTPVRWKHENA
jgi:acyl-CoA synthetase